MTAALPPLPTAFAGLDTLAYNLRSTWDPAARAVFERLDPDTWSSSRGNPVQVLQALAGDRLADLATDAGVVAQVQAAVADLEDYLDAPRWWDGLPDPPACIAYLSPEFGITEILPQYSGGLGVLAGDHLKAASDLGVPIVGVGLLYRHGYFEQSIGPDGRQTERHVELDVDTLPLVRLLDDDGTPRRVHVPFPDTVLHAEIWKAQVGRVTLLLLDAEIADNAPAERAVTEILYGGDAEMRIRQELLLGAGGIRALDAYGVRPAVFHMNEGHAGFLGIERMRQPIAEGLDPDEAVEAVRPATVFTTHTPVPAGIDRFERPLAERR